MIRFTLNNKDYYNFKETDFLNVNNYISFIDELEKIDMIEGLFLYAHTKEKFYLISIEILSKKIRILNKLCYTFENEKMYEVFETITNSKTAFSENTLDFKLAVCNYKTNYKFLMDYNVFRIILCAKKLKFEGKPLFNKFKLKTKKKVREIVAPDPEIKKNLQLLNKILQKTYDKRNINFQVAYKKNKNIKSNAEIHKNKLHILNFDLKNFFSSCKRESVKKYITYLIYQSQRRDNIINEFLDIILLDNALFIGSPISGTLANVIISNSVNYINNICNKYNINFSIYADDMSFSSDKFISKTFIKKIIKSSFQKYNEDDSFDINKKKIFGASKCSRKVTGLSINNKNQITVPRKYYRDLRVAIDKLSKNQNIKYNMNELRGKISYAIMIDESGKIYKYLIKYKDVIINNKLASNKIIEELKGEK